MKSDPLDKIRDAVLDSASAGVDPSEVIALLLKISGETAITTQTMNRALACAVGDTSRAARAGEAS